MHCRACALSWIWDQKCVLVYDYTIIGEPPFSDFMFSQYIVCRDRGTVIFERLLGPEIEQAPPPCPKNEIAFLVICATYEHRKMLNEKKLAPYANEISFKLFTFFKSFVQKERIDCIQPKT